MSEETQVSQETSNLEAAPAQDTSTPPTNETTQPESKSEGTTTPQEKIWEYNGDRKDVPKEFQQYVKGVDRYWSKKSQTLAELGQKAREYEEFRNSSEFKAFQQFKEKPAGTVPSEAPQPVVTQDEIDAIALGDAATLEKVIERKAKQLLESTVNPKLEAITKLDQQFTLKQKESEAADTIKSFSELNPDFNELLDSPVGEFMIDAARRGMDIESIYKSAKAAEDYFSQKMDAKKKADFEKKKAGTTVGKSIPGTPDIVYADDENSAKRLAIELTLKGDKRHVRIKPKQK